MRKAIISDVHANLNALNSVLKNINEQNIDQIISLGDFIGYGEEPKECIDRLIDVVDISLKGNHELSFLSGDYEGYIKEAISSLQKTKKQLKTSFKDMFSFNFLKKWKRKRYIKSTKEFYIDETNTLYVHGSPNGHYLEYLDVRDYRKYKEGYNFAESKLDYNFNMIERLCFNGHSHLPGILIKAEEDIEFDSLKLKEGYHNIKLLPDEKYLIKDNEKSKAIINVGSIGCPRDGIEDPCYFIYDTDENFAQFKRIKT